MSDPAFEAEIRDLISRNQKIMAVKLYRERTGVGLAEAKAAVEAVQAGRSVGHALAPASHVAPSQPSGSAVEPMELTVARLIREDRKLDAIKWVRERTGLGLAEAKHWVDAIQSSGPFPLPGVQPPVATASPAPNSADAELIDVANRMGKIEAIKLHRTRFGSGLADAKNYVDALLDRASRGGVVALPANAPAPVVHAPKAPPPVAQTVFGASSASARSALAQAPLPETMPSWAANPKAVVSSYVPRERKSFADSGRTSGDNSALGAFLITGVAAIVTIAGAIAFLVLR